MLITDSLDASRRKNFVNGVMEHDVTKFKQESKEQKISFLSTVLHAIGQAAIQYPVANSYKKGSKLIEFNEVDICVVVERNIGTVTMPLPYIIRNAHQKSAAEIHVELEQAKNGNVNDLFMHKHMRIYLALPKIIRKLYWRYLFFNPHQFKKRLGTIAVTALHSTGHGVKHFNPISPYTVTIALGRISKNTTGEYLMNFTITIDHDILDGMDAVKFSRMAFGR